MSTFGRRDLLAGLVGALESQTLPHGAFEVVVVDDGSVDATWEVLSGLARSSPLRLRAVRSRANRGAARARDLAVAHTRAPAVAFTDDDCLPDPRWLEAMQAAFAGGADVVQGRTVADEAGRPAAGHWARTVWVPEPSGLFETCNVAYRRGVLDAAGGFASAGAMADVEGRPFGEDAVLGDRAVSAGARFSFAADAVVRHRYEPAGFLDHVREQRRMARFAALAARSPSFRRRLWCGVFLSRVTAAADLAAAGAVLAAVAVATRRRPWALLSTLPWLVARWPEARHRAGGRHPAVRYPQLAVVDAVAVAFRVAGGVRHRRPVL